MKTLHCRARRAGFTLVELVVTIAVLAVLLTLAAPSFIEFQRNSQLSAAANTFVAALNAARTEAMKRNVPAMVVPLDGAWGNGFVAFADLNFDSSLDAADKVVQRQALALSYLTIAGTGPASETPAYVRYDGSGFARRTNNGTGNLTLSFSRNDVTGDAAHRQIRRIVVSPGGRVRVCTPDSASDTKCAAGGDD